MKPVALVTGATGFIGGALAAKLHETHEVVCIVRNGDQTSTNIDGLHIIGGPLEDLSVCERAIVQYQPDVVYHLAAQAMVGIAKRDPFHTFESNVRGTYNLLEAFRRHHKPGSGMVVASSDKAYGELPSGQYRESDPLNGIGIYDCSKACTDMITQSYAKSFNLPISIVRAGNVYGPGDTEKTRIVPSMISDVMAGKNITIMSDGTPIRDYIYIDDVVAGYMFVKPSWRRAYNLATGIETSVKDLAQTLLEVAGMSSFAYDILSVRTGEIQRQVLSPARLRNDGFETKVSLREGLKRTLNAAVNK